MCNCTLGSSRLAEADRFTVDWQGSLTVWGLMISPSMMLAAIAAPNRKPHQELSGVLNA